MRPLVAIVGPTATGKSRLAVRLAQRFNGEIIGADSRQVYRYMDIGTAKPDSSERSLVPHHIIDIIDPDEPFSLAQYRELATAAIDSIHERHTVPFLVGGTGLYIKAMLEGWQTPEVSPDPRFRYNMEERAKQEGGPQELYRQLTAIDPAAAEKTDPRNVRRVIRALEVINCTGKLFSEAGTRIKPPYDTHTIGLTAERGKLYEIADRRVDHMLARGLVDEVKNLVAMGYGYDLPSMSGIGYQQIGQYLKGELTLQQATEKIKTATHRFIRHQYAWFRLSDESIHWYGVEDIDSDTILNDIAGFLR